MGKLNINGGGVDTNKKMASIDERFGPYSSIEAANAALGGQGRNTITAGLTVGILTANAGVKEYWYQPNKKSGILELIPKGGNAADSPTEGNFAEFDSNGNVKDSGCNESTFIKGVQKNGDDLTPDANGKVNVTVQDGVTPHIDQTTKHWMIGEEDTEVDAEGKSAYQIYAASVPQGETPMTEPQWLASLKGEKGDNAVNPFKGIYGSDNKPTGTFASGDYIYAPTSASGQTGNTIWKWNGTTWQDSGETPDMANAETFASSETLQQVAIDNSHLVNPVNSADSTQPVLAQAEDVMQLKAKLKGVTASEDKISPSLVSELGTYIKSDNTTGSSTGFQYGTFIIPNGSKRVRFVGYVKAGQPATAGYCFIDSNDVVKGGGVMDNDASAQSPIKKEYMVDVPEGSTVFKTNVTGSAISDFYCYFENGETIKEYVDGKSEEIIGRDYIKVGNNIAITTGDSYAQFHRPTTDVEENAVLIKGSSGWSRTYNCTNHIGQKIRVLSNGSYYMYYAFAKKGISSIASSNNSATLGQLVNGGYLSDVHYDSGTDTWKSLFIVSTIGQYVDIDIPNDAVYIYFVWRFTDENNSNRLPVDVRFVDVVHEKGVLDDKIESVDNKITALSEQVNEENASSKVTFSIGIPSTIVGNKFSIDETDKKFACSSPIPMTAGFYLRVKEDYCIIRVMTYDDNDVLVQDLAYYTNNSVLSNESYNSSFLLKGFGQDKVTPQYNLRIIVMKKGNAFFDEGELLGIVSKLLYFNDSRLKFEKNTNYANFKERLRQISNIVWNPLKIVPYWGDSTIFFKAGTVVRGVPYSEAAEYTHYYGQHINARTFLSALKNPWSVMYTENIATNINRSKYGYTYRGLSGYSAAFYGTVCTGLTSYVANYPTILSSSQWGSGDVTMIARGNHAHPYGWRTPNGNDSYSPELAINGTELFDMIQEMDFIWNTGHCSVVSDIIDDDNDNRMFMVWAEQTTPRTTIRPFSADEFVYRVYRIANTLVDSSNPNGGHKEWAIYRMTPAALARISKPEDFGDYVQTNWWDYTPKDIEIDEEIMCFKGEYCSVGHDVTEGSQHEDWDSSLNDYRLFLNVKQGDKYKYVDIYAEDDDTLSNIIVRIDIDEETTANATLITNLYGTNEEGWSLVNVANKNLAHGLYKAQAVSSDGEVTSNGFSHFEIVDIDFSVSVNANTVNCEFSSIQGTPYLIRQERSTGMSPRFKELTGEEVTAGSCTFTKYTTEQELNRYIKLFVRGTYGVVVKRIDTYNLS